MRADKIIEAAYRDMPSSKELGLAALNVPVFDFGKFDYPDFTGIQEDSMICWNEGLLELPFDECCFLHSYSLINDPDRTFSDCWSLYHVVRDSVDRSVSISEWRVFHALGRGQVGQPPTLKCVVYPNKQKPTVWTVVWTPAEWVDGVMLSKLKNYLSTGNGISEFIDPVMAMALYLNTKGVVSERVPAPSRLNMSRLKKGKLPIPEHYVVKICPSVLGKHSGTESHGHASPRAHYRRGHIRVLEGGKTTWVRACIVAGSVHDAVVPTYQVSL